MLLPFEQLHIQSLHQAGKLIPEQYPNDPNPLFSTDLQSPTPYKPQIRASKAAARKPDTRPSAPRHKDKLKTKGIDSFLLTHAPDHRFRICTINTPPH
jgi:hypothetical protein